MRIETSRDAAVVHGHRSVSREADVNVLRSVSNTTGLWINHMILMSRDDDACTC